MAQSNLGFFDDARLANPDLKAWDGTFSDVPPGEYDFEIIEAEVKNTNGATPLPRLALKVKVLSGEFAGQTLFHGFMLAGSDPKKDTHLKRIKALTDALAITVDAKGRWDMNLVLGRKFTGTVIHGTYEKVDVTTGQKSQESSINIGGERPIDATKPAKGVKAVAAGSSKNGSAQPAAAGSGIQL